MVCLCGVVGFKDFCEKALINFPCVFFHFDQVANTLLRKLDIENSEKLILAIFQGFDGILDQLLVGGADKIPVLCNLTIVVKPSLITTQRIEEFSKRLCKSATRDWIMFARHFLMSDDLRKYLANLIDSIGEMLRKSLDFFQIFI